MKETQEEKLESLEAQYRLWKWKFDNNVQVTKAKKMLKYYSNQIRGIKESLKIDEKY